MVSYVSLYRSCTKDFSEFRPRSRTPSRTIPAMSQSFCLNGSPERSGEGSPERSTPERSGEGFPERSTPEYSGDPAEAPGFSRTVGESVCSSWRKSAYNDVRLLGRMRQRSSSGAVPFRRPCGTCARVPERFFFGTPHLAFSETACLNAPFFVPILPVFREALKNDEKERSKITPLGGNSQN